MKQIVTIVLLLACIYAQAQTQSLCPGDTDAKRYWVTKTDGSSYTWKITSGSGVVTSGQGTNEVYVQWSGAETATLQVVETNIGNCIGTPVELTISFDGPTAELLGMSSNLCDVPSSTNLSVSLSGDSPWDISYSINGELKTATGITTSPYPIAIDGMAQGNVYTVELTGVSDKSCPGSVSGTAKTITIYPAVNTSAIQFE